jgi:hypothetical protein
MRYKGNNDMSITKQSITLFAACATLVLTGCGAPHLAAVRTAKHALVGEDVAVLSRCVGEPLSVRAFETPAGIRMQSYVYSSAQPRGPDGLLIGAPAPDAEAEDRACVFDFAVEAGRIVAVRSDNRAGWGFGSIKKCSAVIERCVNG